MIILALALLCIGSLVALLSGVWTLALAFQRNVLWGLAVLVVPLGNVAFVCARWRDARTPFFLGLGSLALMGSALFSMPADSVRGPLQATLANMHMESTAAPAESSRMARDRAEAENQLRLLRLKRQETALKARKAAVNTANRLATQTLTVEIARYNFELAESLPSEKRHQLVAR